MSTVAESPSRAGEWLEDPGYGVYVHIPFCLHRCNYCDFNTYEGQQGLHQPYVEALVEEIERWRGPGRRATSVFFGGGTPTLLDAHQLGRLLEAVRHRFGIDAEAEITIEANPETVDEAKFESLLAAGFNRFSIGVQSLSAEVLARLGRTHSARDALAALGAARRAGADDVNADLIYGSPWERSGDWAATLEGIIEAAPDHVSAYACTVEEGTPLHTLVRTGRASDVDPDLQAERHGVAAESLAGAGYARYEISNWARPGRASRHNLLYWSAGDYAGLGAGAHGHAAGQRWWSVRRPRDFIDAVNAGATTRAGGECLSRDERAGEALMLGLRLTSGVDLDGFVRRFGRPSLDGRAEEVAALESLGLLERSGRRLALTPRATMVANEVASRLL